MWDINITKKHERANIIIQQDRTKSEYAAYIHACLYSPATSTLLRAIRNSFLVGFPGITKELFSKHLLASIATAKGHLDQERSNLRSTKVLQAQPESTIIDDHFPGNTPATKTGEAYAKVEPILTSTSYSDQTGRFPKQASRGYQYIFIYYDHDSNAILAEPIKSRSSADLTTAWQKCHAILASKNIASTMHVLDNEISNEMRQAINDTGTTVQRVPPNIHRRNAAERAIRIFKNHFIAGLASTDPKFPAREWDRLIPQAVITLNIMRQCRINPKLSAYAYLFGQFDFNATPLAPPGTRVLAHEKPQQRKTWAPHGVDGWYIGPALEHYRCITCYIPSTGKERIVDTVQWFPHVVPIPAASTDDYLRQAAADIIALLDTRQQHPTLATDPSTASIVRQVADLLQRAAPTPSPISLPSPVPTVPALSTPISANLPNANTSEPARFPRVHNPNPGRATAQVPRVGARSNVIPPTSAVSPANQRTPTVAIRPPARALPAPIANSPSTTPARPKPVHVADTMPHNQSKYAARAPNSPSSTPHQHHGRHPPWQPMHQLHQLPRLHRPTNMLQRAQLITAPTTARLQQQHCNHIFHPATGKRQTLTKLMEGSTGDADVWATACSNEFGRLLNGVGDRVKGTNTIRQIHRSNIPAGRDVTYANFVCDHRPHKPEKHRVRMCVGGDRLSYPDSPSSPAADMTDVKLLLNSTISTEGARFATCDIKDFYLNTPMKRFEYMKIHRRHIPQDIQQQYKMEAMFDKDGYAYFEIMKGMYGLKQAGLIAYNQLVKNLAPHGYHPVKHTTGLWSHKPTNTFFTLIIDDFGIKYQGKKNAQRLFDALRNYYTISVDWSGSQYCGLTLDWQYEKRYVDLSVPDYIPKLLQKHNYSPKCQRDAPHEWTPPAYGARVQYAKDMPNEQVLDKAGTKYIQSITGSCIYYARAVDSSMLVAINELGANQAASTASTRAKADWLLDYAATHPNAKVRFFASGMILYLDSDAAYLVLPNARSRMAGFYFLGDKPPDPPTIPKPKPNGAVHVECRTIRNVVSSAAESETGALFYNSQRAIPIRIALEELGHPQPPTPVKTDNATALGYIESNIRQKRSKSWDMRYHWLRDRDARKQFRYYWAPGSDNWGDYFTKHHSPAVHREKRKFYFV